LLLLTTGVTCACIITALQKHNIHANKICFIGCG
jgi:hypothetical protein